MAATGPPAGFSAEANLALYVHHDCDWNKIPGSRKRVADVLAVIKLLAPSGFEGSGTRPRAKPYKLREGREHVKKLVTARAKRVDDDEDL